MDIITHAAIGVTLAGTLIAEPALALGILIGSVLPDLDVLARLFGRRAMLLNHQTFSHSLPLLWVISTACGLIPALGWMFGGGLLGGAALHVILDYSNTLGVTLFWPFVRKRLHTDWVFFIDIFVMTVALLAASLVMWQLYQEGHATPAIAFAEGLVLVGYWCFKGWLKKCAGAMAGGDAVSVLPSAVWPWQFYVCKRGKDDVTVQRLSMVGQEWRLLSSHQVFDSEVSDIVSDLPEWRLMRELSPAYHAIRHERSETGRFIACRDLRVRNFDTRFGDLELQVSPDGKILHATFHV